MYNNIFLKLGINVLVIWHFIILKLFPYITKDHLQSHQTGAITWVLLGLEHPTRPLLDNGVDSREFLLGIMFYRETVLARIWLKMTSCY